MTKQQQQILQLAKAARKAKPASEELLKQIRELKLENQRRRKAQEPPLLPSEQLLQAVHSETRKARKRAGSQ